MVCHPLPPPIPLYRFSSRVLFELLVRPQYYNRLTDTDLNANIFTQRINEFANKAGFTPLADAMIRYYVDYYGKDSCLYIIRSIEEGWVALTFIDGCPLRWKRLGWLDWVASGVDYLNDESAISEAAEQVSLAISKDSGKWAWGDDGWRADFGVPISHERLARMVLGDDEMLKALKEGLPVDVDWN